ncbi:MAG: 50S ribosomal protein L11 methyltransferase [Pseudomonadaceae bacterium]|nr:50S ribosomal protein L11 methyltransferase [Pseudomonadaceae bacterium]
MTWLAVQLTAPGALVDAVSDCFDAAGAEAVLLLDGGDEAILEPAPGETPIWPEARIQALLPVSCDIASLRAALGGVFDEARQPFPGCDVDFVAEPDTDDGSEPAWRQHAVNRCFNDKLWIVPKGEGRELVGAVVELDPGLAFGTGSHPTTSMCLAALAEQELTDRRVLDFGCGSGILALAALKLGAKAVLACDHDPQALLATRDNAQYNNIPEDSLELVSSLGMHPPVDLLVANVLANPLIELAPSLISYVREGGMIVLSGLLVDQAESVALAYPGVEFEPTRVEGEWAALVGRLS